MLLPRPEVLKDSDVVIALCLVEGRRQFHGAGDPVPALDWRQHGQACRVYGSGVGLAVEEAARARIQ